MQSPSAPLPHAFLWPATVTPAPYPPSTMPSWTKSVRPTQPTFRFVAAIGAGFAALPALGVVFGAAWLHPYGNTVPWLVQVATIGGGLVLGAFLTVPFVRWAPVERGS